MTYGYFCPIIRRIKPVQHLVVDSFTTVLRSYFRLTVDLDLVMDLPPNKAKKAIPTLKQLRLMPQLHPQPF